VQCQDDGEICLYGEVWDGWDEEYEDICDDFVVKYVDWNAQNQMHFFVKAANHLNGFVAKFVA
jgi:hypothetical protein